MEYWYEEFFTISNESIINARVHNGVIHVNLWAEGYTDAEPNKVVLTPKEVLWHIGDYQFNQNFVLVNYYSQPDTEHYELWYLSHPAVQLTLPNCDAFLTEEERLMFAKQRLCLHWILDTNSNSDYLVILYYSSEGNVKFGLVFDGFTSHKYRHRISFAAHFGAASIKMQNIGSGKDAKTVLTALSEHSDECYVYEMSNGQTLLTIPLDRLHSSSGHYLFPEGDLTDEDHSLGGVNVIRIECNGKNWTTCTTFVSYGHVEGFGNMISLIAVTDTQTLWKVDMDDGSSYCIMCDYLLNELH